MTVCDIAENRKPTKIILGVVNPLSHIKYSLTVRVAGAVKTRYSAAVLSPRFVAANGNTAQ